MPRLTKLAGFGEIALESQFQRNQTNRLDEVNHREEELKLQPDELPGLPLEVKLIHRLSTLGIVELAPL
jgi:hypothetical protein